MSTTAISWVLYELSPDLDHPARKPNYQGSTLEVWVTNSDIGPPDLSGVLVSATLRFTLPSPANC